MLDKGPRRRAKTESKDGEQDGEQGGEERDKWKRMDGGSLLTCVSINVKDER